MATPMSSTFTMSDRRKKVVTYGRSARFTAAQDLQDDAASPERPRKHAQTTHRTTEKGTALKSGSTLKSTRVGRPKERATQEGAVQDIFDVPSDNEPTPRPSAAQSKKIPPAQKVVDEFEFPESEDERPSTIRKAGRSTQPSRMADPIQPLVYASKNKTQTHQQSAIPSSEEAVTAPVPTTRRRAKTPQATQKPIITDQSQTATRTSTKPSTRSRATTPAAPGIVAQKTTKDTARVPPKKVVTKRPISKPSDLDIFDVPSTDEDAPAKTPVTSRPARTKLPSVPPVSHAPPSPAPSAESDVSTASHKRKRRTSVSSTATTKPTRPSDQKGEDHVLRGKKYQKKEVRVASGYGPVKESSQSTLRHSTKSEEHTHTKPRRTRLPPDSSATKPRIAKGQSSPATLHTMLAVRSLPKPPTIPQEQAAPDAEDETMYDIPEAATPLPRVAKPIIPGSVTPRQQMLFSNLLGDSDSTTPMPSISRLRLTEQRPQSGNAALGRSSSDVPQSAHSRKGRLIDILKQAAPSSDEDSESDEETEGDKTEVPANAPIVPAVDSNAISEATPDVLDVDMEAATNSQASQASVLMNSGARVTYAKQRSMLEETNFEDELMLAMDIDDNLGLEATNRQASVSEDGDDLTQVRGIHELRRQGQQYRFQSEASASIDDISAKGGLNSSQRRSAVVEIAGRMADKSYVGQLLESSLTASLLRSIAPTGEIIFDFAAAVAVLFILESRPGFAVLDQIYQSGALETLKGLMISSSSSLDIHRIARDRKTNMSKSGRETVAEFRSIIVGAVWPEEKPEKVSPQLVAMKALEGLVLGLRKAGNTDAIVGEDMVAMVLDAASFPVQHLKSGKATAQDSLTLATTFSILESLSVTHGKQGAWSNEMLGRLANMMPVFFETSSESPRRLVIRLCMNLTNNRPEVCQLFAWPSFVLPLLRSISYGFKMLASEMAEERRGEVLEDVILSLGAMINLAEYSEQARASVVRDGDGLIRELVGTFLEGSARAEQADSMEESQSSVTIGYLTVLLGNLCLDGSVRATVQSCLPGGRIDMLVQKVKEFVLYNQRVDRLTGQFEGTEGEETLKNFTARLMRVVEGLERAAE